MKTGDLIEALAADAGSRAAGPATVVPAALASGATVAALLFFAVIGVREDVAAALSTARFPFKFLVVLALAVPAALLLPRFARPGAAPRGAAALLAFPVLAAAGVAAELIAVPSADWPARLVGSNALVCLTTVPALALAPLAALLLALRHGAPTRPGTAGAIAGLAAGGIGAFLYGWHCTDDSPLFVATWYSLAVGLVTAAGALLGRRLLRW